ncbi:hypothetical protein QVD17_23839 [Tagetes erecta]|uniref:Gnk2-homologous domain-containing protein n=1 Tax=Tagetes erecta TaxID=13708 RepID=A0AAD8KKW9_TARER|nr:hypothetical protein QVD17_23839 [Tagetes erecta]
MSVHTMISSSIFATLVVVFILTATQLVASQSRNMNNTLLRKYCRSDVSANGDSYLINMNITFSSLRRQLSVPRVYYAFDQTNTGEFVYAFALCREYLSTSQCLACFDSAVNETKSCGIADGGNMIYDDCSIRYENFRTYFDNAAVIVDDVARPSQVCNNDTTSLPITMFNQVATPKQ